MSLGPVMLDLEGTVLTPAERELLRHPRAGGVILFSRNYDSPQQLSALVAAVHALRQPPLLVAVDHEGGRVQRFREGFTRLPPAGRIGQVFDRAPGQGLALAREAGWLMASELRAVGVDFSFAPVLDLHRGLSRVIDDRAYHPSPDAVADLARAAMGGMRAAGMGAVGKHFPGHGAVVADSHEELPEDPRPFADIEAEDLVPFARLIHAGLPAVMPAHVVYPALDRRPAGYSRRWIQDVLRRRLGFDGVVFSDDLSMAGAAGAGDYLERARLALDAGCDMLLVCNAPGAVAQVLEGLAGPPDPVSQARLVRMHGRDGVDRARLERAPRWQRARELLAALDAEPELPLGDDNLS